MPWVRDEASGDWVWIESPVGGNVTVPPLGPPPRDPLAPPPHAQVGPYVAGESRSGYPLDDVQRHPREEGPALGPASPMATYRNEDDELVARWEAEAVARGNAIRHTAGGVFEVDENGRIVSEIPSPYRKV